MKLRVLLLAAVIGAGRLLAEDAVVFPSGGRDLLPSGSLAGAQAMLPKDNQIAVAEVLRAGDAPWTEFWRVHVKHRPANSWSVQVSSAVRGSIAKGDKCVLVFYTRAVEGQASGMAAVEVREAPKYPKLGSTQFRAGLRWQPVLLPFAADENGPDGKCAVTIHLGGEVQQVDIGGLRLLDYGQDFPLNRLPQPRFSYEGRDPDAAWRKEALARIEKHRQGDFALTLLDRNDKPLVDAAVQVRLKRHAFGFGTAVTAKWLTDESSDGVRYRDIVDECFSRVVFENDMKPEPWAKSKSQIDTPLRWLNDRHFSVRGHYLCWGPFESWSEKLKDDPAAIRERVLSWMREIVPIIGNRVSEWDALNHPAGWEPKSTINTVLGDAFYTEVFHEARRLTRLPLWINEDQVFRPGRQQEEYYQIIQKLIASGVKPDGLGNQAHMHCSFLPSPVEMLANSDRFAELVPALQITEFDVGTNGDEALAADFTRDSLIMAFSHPAYTGFVLWGFWEGAHWKPETALWRKDWTEKPAAKVWRDLVGKQWRTQTQTRTDPKGNASFRGYFGLYEVTVRTPEKTLTSTINLSPDEPRAAKIKLSLP